jgi:hypothetical protein
MPPGHIRLGCNEWLSVRFRSDATRGRRSSSDRCGDVGNLEGSTGPWQVVQALREQSGMSTPHFARAVHQDVSPYVPSNSVSSMM